MSQRPFVRRLCRSPQQRIGITLIELLIVISIVSVICLAIYQLINNGVKVWERSLSTVQEENIALFFEKITQDMRNTFIYSTIPIEGFDSRMSFPTLIKDTVQDADTGEDTFIEQIGQVEYTFDFNEDCVIRRQWNYGQSMGKEIISGQKVLKDVDQVSFRYIYFKDEGEITTAEAIDVVPSTVEITVKYTDSSGQKVLQKYIDLPVGM